MIEITDKAINAGAVAWALNDEWDELERDHPEKFALKVALEYEPEVRPILQAAAPHIIARFLRYVTIGCDDVEFIQFLEAMADDVEASAN